MKIGIITHHFASNFGANIQTMSTIEYIKKAGHTPIIVNWTNNTLVADYKKSIPNCQYIEHKVFADNYYPLSEICVSKEDMARVIEKEGIEAIIIGSDAVVQHHPFITRIAFPTRRVISFHKFTEDRLFPNFFWGDFLPYLKKKIPMAYMSVSCQNSPYHYIVGKTRGLMRDACSKFNFISVRDSWTKKMFVHLNPVYESIRITPDPVFALNNNAGKLLHDRETILKKFNLPEKYFLISFFKGDKEYTKWVRDFATLVKQDGTEPYMFPFPNGTFDMPGIKKIDIPLSPIDWYCLIKYSSGFVGRNMHPIVVCLHNQVPFFSFDQYGTKILNSICVQSSSKIYDILSRANLLEYRATSTGLFQKRPTPNEVYEKIGTFDVEQCKVFTERQYNAYLEMMKAILASFR